MANKHRGEASLEIDGKAYTLVFTTNALCDLEELLGKSVGQIMQQMDRVSTIRALLWAGLQASEPGLTVKAAGDLMHVAGNTAVMKAVTEALNRAFPQEKAAPENP